MSTIFVPSTFSLSIYLLEEMKKTHWIYTVYCKSGRKCQTRSMQLSVSSFSMDGWMDKYIESVYKGESRRTPATAGTDFPSIHVCKPSYVRLWRALRLLLLQNRLGSYQTFSISSKNTFLLLLYFFISSPDFFSHSTPYLMHDRKSTETCCGSNYNMHAFTHM